MALSRSLTTQEDIDKAVGVCAESMVRRLNKKGWWSVIGPHEAGGIVQEEVNEMWDAIRKNDRRNLKEELVDVAVACIYALASFDALEKEEILIAERKKASATGA